MFLKIVSHALGFGERFIRSFSAGNDADGIRILIQIFDGFVETVAKYKARAGLTHLGAEHHHIIKIRFALRMHFTDDATFHRAEHDQTNTHDRNQDASDQSWQYRPPPEEQTESEYCEQNCER